MDLGQLVTLFKSPARVFAVIGVVSLALLLLPAQWMSQLGLAEIRDSAWPGLGVITSAAFLLVQAVLVV